jgi:glycine/D-amino acid oxidase-like deaminating enzyme
VFGVEERTMRADVAVIGVGAMGSMALWRLAARGASVIAFERFEPGHDRGSSHGLLQKYTVQPRCFSPGI